MEKPNWEIAPKYATQGDLLIESREVLDCISSLSSKLFDEFINDEYDK